MKDFDSVVNSLTLHNLKNTEGVKIDGKIGRQYLCDIIVVKYIIMFVINVINSRTCRIGTKW